MTPAASTLRRPKTARLATVQVTVLAIDFHKITERKEAILRNYLAEAFRIAANPQANLPVERAHVVALTAYARQTVNALMSVQEVA
jgi:hypothetical protein